MAIEDDIRNALRDYKTVTATYPLGDPSSPVWNPPKKALRDALAKLGSVLDAGISVKGEFNASGGSFPSSSSKGDAYIVRNAGTIDGISLAVNDLVIALIDSASTSSYSGNWARLSFGNVFSSRLESVETIIDGLQTDVLVTGGNAPNITENASFNYLSKDSNAGGVAAGTGDQPNLVGVPCEVFEFTGDGLQTAFACSTSVSVTDESYLTVRVFLIDGSTRSVALMTEGVDFTVSGYGTATVTVTMTNAVSTGDVLRVRLYDKADAGNAPLLNFITDGYDNANDGSGSMVIITGAHHTNIDNPGGHNTFQGGSSTYMHSGTSYSYAAGLSHEFDGVLGGFASGGRGRLTGSWPAHFGNRGSVGGYSVHFGDGGDVKEFFSAHFGRRGKSKIPGEFVIGCGAVSDPDVGLLQSGRYNLRRELSGNTLTTLIPITGSANYVLPKNSIATVSAIVTIVDKADLDNFIKLKLETTVKREAGDATTVIGDNSAAAAQITVLDKGGAAVNSAGVSWDARLYNSSATGAFSIFARGATGLTCMAIADVTVQVVSADAV